MSSTETFIRFIDFIRDQRESGNTEMVDRAWKTSEMLSLFMDEEKQLEREKYSDDE